jgi:hypothetical protein
MLPVSTLTTWAKEKDLKRVERATKLEEFENSSEGNEYSYRETQ